MLTCAPDVSVARFYNLGAMDAYRPRRVAVTRLFAAQVVVFTALGWAVAGIVTVAGGLKLSDALFVSGLIGGVLAGLIALESSDMPVTLPLRASQTLSLTGVMDRAGLGVGLVDRVQALAVVAAGVNAAGLIVAAVALG